MPAPRPRWPTCQSRSRTQFTTEDTGTTEFCFSYPLRSVPSVVKKLMSPCVSFSGAMANAPTLSLDGKVALITGGSRGIGAATVRLFARAGARVVFNYVRSQDEARRLVEEFGDDRCHTVWADLAGASNAEPLVHAAVERFGALDALVVNHGIWPPDKVAIDQMTDEQWRRTVATNLDSAFALTKHAVAQMKRQGRGGHIVYISSTAGQRGEDHHTDYAATKGAVISMTRASPPNWRPSASTSTASRRDGWTHP